MSAIVHVPHLNAINADRSLRGQAPQLTRTPIEIGRAHV